MLQAITRIIHPLPVPIFGTVGTASAFMCAKSKVLPKLVGWAGPLTVGGLWFVWPAVDDNWKIEMGLRSKPKEI